MSNTLIQRTARLARDDESMRGILMPLLREAEETDREAILRHPKLRRSPKKKGPRSYSDYRRDGGNLTEKEWQSRQRGSRALGVRG